MDARVACYLSVKLITDVSEPGRLAGNLGIFQGLSAGGAFIFAFPIGGVLGSKYGPRLPLYIAAGLQLLNAMIILFITPESNKPMKTKKLDLREVNPIGGLRKLFANAPILRTAAMIYFLLSLARCSLDAQFTNYSNIRFGWTQAQAGPVLVLVGIMYSTRTNTSILNSSTSWHHRKIVFLSLSIFLFNTYSF